MIVCGYRRCIDSGAWFYIAQGSGVSVNVGNTLVVDERIVQRLSPSHATERWLDGAISSLYSDAAAFPAAFHDKNPLAAALNLTASFVRSLDSIQRLWHKEGWVLS